MEYPKIETLFDRDPQTFKVRTDAFRLPEFAIPKWWLVTEKVDGTNIRIHLTPDGRVQYGGKTDAAQIPATLVTVLRALLPDEQVAAAFEPDTEAVLYGEGYGAKINSGGDYRRSPVPGFRLFDVLVTGAEGRRWWLNWENVVDVARKLSIQTVPVLARALPLDQAVACVDARSETASEDGGNRMQEGIVARTEPLLLTRAGARLVWKLKLKDLG